MPAHGTEIRLDGVDGKKGSVGVFLNGCESNGLGLALLRLDVVDPEKPAGSDSPMLYFAGMEPGNSRIVTRAPSFWPDSVWDHLRAAEK
jgi:hypothetical protein